MDSNNIISSHYNLDNYIPIFKRRSERFLNSIKNNNKIVFIRLCVEDEKIKEDDIKQFNSIIYNVNNTIEFKLLFIERHKNIEDFEEVKHINLIHKCLLYNDVINTDNLINHFNKTFEYEESYILEINKYLTDV